MLNFEPQFSNLPKIEFSNNWYSIKSPISLVIQPQERKVVNCGYSINQELDGEKDNSLYCLETPLQMALKGVLIISSNLNTIRKPNEELTFIIQNLNFIESYNPLAIFGDRNKLQISVGDELVRMRVINN